VLTAALAIASLCACGKRTSSILLRLSPETRCASSPLDCGGEVGLWIIDAHTNQVFAQRCASFSASPGRTIDDLAAVLAPRAALFDLPGDRPFIVEVAVYSPASGSSCPRYRGNSGDAIPALLGRSSTTSLAQAPEVDVPLECVAEACASSISTAGHVYSVATNGSDANDGTEAAPFATVQHGVDVASAGDTIVVEDGVYPPTAACSGGNGFAVQIDHAGTPSAWITLRARHARGATLDGQLSCYAYINLQAGAAYWNIEGFAITGGYWAAVWSNAGAHHYALRANELMHVGNRLETTGLPIASTGASPVSHDVIIEGNILHDIGRTGGYPTEPDADSGMEMKSSATQIINNVCYPPISGACILTGAGFSGIIANNTLRGPMLSLYDGTPLTGLITLWDRNDGLILQNNIIDGAAVAAIKIVMLAGLTPLSCAIDHNLISGQIALTSHDISSACTLGPNLANGVPSFVAGGAPHDFHLSLTSQAIDTGVTLPEVQLDFDRVLRPQGAAYDIGAFERPR
jgi:hypothetical protein